MKAVKFIQSWDIYFEGEVAGFDDKVADILVDNLRVAELYKKKKDEEFVPTKR